MKGKIKRNRNEQTEYKGLNKRASQQAVREETKGKGNRTQQCELKGEELRGRATGREKRKRTVNDKLNCLSETGRTKEHGKRKGS